MSNYAYEAVDSGGQRIQGVVEVVDQSEALKRIKEMGLFPTKITQAMSLRTKRNPARLPAARKAFSVPILGGRVKPVVLTVFTRQLATLIDAGMPLLRGLRILREQEESRTLKRIVGQLAASIEDGSSLSEALAAHPRVFNPLYVNMIKAGEISGALEMALRRLAEFMEKAHRIKGKVKAAMFYPIAVMIVATIILGVLMVYVVPRFQEVFDGLLNGRAMPAFTLFVLKISSAIKSHFVIVAVVTLGLIGALRILIQTRPGRRIFDRSKLTMPLLGPVFRKVAISRFARTLGTLLGNGVPVLQALTIVKETAGNVVVGKVIANIHASVKEGESIAVPLKASNVFPAMVAGMVDIGEQTGALPDMLMKIADNYDDEVDNAVNAMTSLLEPIMIVFLAVVVGSIVIALFLPLIAIINPDLGNPGAGGTDN